MVATAKQSPSKQTELGCRTALAEPLSSPEPCFLQDIAIVEPRPPEPRSGSSSSGGSQEAVMQPDPRHCVLLRAGGLLSVLDMDQVP